MDNNADTMQEVYKLIRDRKKAGDTKEQIVEKLIQSGHFEESETGTLMEQVEYVMMKMDETKVTPSSLLMAILGGLAAAIIGGAIWYWIIIGADSEYGILAWGIGWICGFAVLLFSQGKKGQSLQIAAAACSIFGIILGKYLAFTHLVSKVVLAEYGQVAADTVKIFSTRVLGVFFESFGEMLSLYDLLWVVLAVGTAWKIAGADLNQLLKRNK